MTDNNTDSQSSESSSSTATIATTTTADVNTRIKIKNSTTKRRSQRYRRNVQPPMRSSSLATTIFHENSPMQGSMSDSLVSQSNEKSFSTDKLLLRTTSTINTKSSFWTITDRESEWYKLSIPISTNSLTTTKETVPSYKKCIHSSKSKRQDQLDQPKDITQVIMKAVMQELDYDMDDDDMKFLSEINEENKSKHKPLLTEEAFENAIIILEFSTAEKIRSHLKQKSCEDDDIVCDICLLPDADEGNEMVFCERCNCCVHQNCYGIPSVPSGTWLCRSCSILRRPSCILCPKLGGPMKCTASGTIWCHLTCALWIPELKFVDYTNMEPVLHLDQIPHARWSLRCVVCSTNEGACVQCAHKNCRTPFHVTCGLAAGYFLDVQQISSKISTSSRSQFNAYCSKHSKEARKRSEEEESNASGLFNEDESSSSTSSLTSSVPLTVYRRNELKSTKWINECQKNFSTFISSTHLSKESPHQYNENLSRKIYEYWINKRLFNKTMPLIKRIDYVLEQRENSDLLVSQINTFLKTRQNLLQLENQSKTLTNETEFSSDLTQRFETIRKTYSRRQRSLSTSSSSSSSHGENKHKIKRKIKVIKRRNRNCFPHDNVNQQGKSCIVSLESTYRENLKANTTYLIGKTFEGQTILLPKDLLEQSNLQTDRNSSTDDNDDDKPCSLSNSKDCFQLTKTPYTSQGNLVKCVTGSFN